MEQENIIISKTQSKNEIIPEKIDNKNIAEDLNESIHVMPKQFKAKTNRSSQLKGILILIAGIAILSGGGIWAYLLLVPKNNPVSQIIPPENIEQPSDLEQEEPFKEEKNDDIITINDAEIISDSIDQIQQEENLNNTTDSALTTDTIDSLIDEVISTSTDEQNMTDDNILIDTDKDGLSEKEELILNTKDTTKDTNSNGIDDLTEILNLNNPAGKGKLTNNSNIGKYSNTAYSLLYPITWTYSSATDDSVIFKSGSGHNIQVLVIENTNQLPLNEWYRSEVSIKEIKTSQKINKNGWEGIKNEDDLSIYLTIPNKTDKVFIISYIPGKKSILVYENIFNLFINSFAIN